MTLQILSLITPIFYDDVFSRITFSLRGSVEYHNFKGYSKCILLMYPKGDVLFLRWNVIIVTGHHRVMR